MSLQNLLTIQARTGRPGALVKLGTSGGRLLYLETATHPVTIVAALEPHDVRQLVTVLEDWLLRRGPVEPVADDDANVLPLVAGAIRRGLMDQAASYREELARLVQLAPLHDRYALCDASCTTDCGACKGSTSVQFRTDGEARSL